MIQVKKCRHGRLMFYDNDLYIGRSLNTHGVYSEQEILLWQQIIKPGWTVVEVGANIGVHTVWLSKAVGSNGLVVAIEPQMQLYHMLCGNLALNEITNTVTVLAAIGKTHGTITVPSISYGKQGNFGGVSLGGSEGATVPVLPLDALRKDPEFIKIDVEGMEADVLRGARETIERCKPILYVENDRKEKSDELIEIIRDLGYVMYWHHPLINRELFGNTVSLNMLCVQPGASVVGLKEVETNNRDDTVRHKAMVSAIEHGAVL